MSVKSDVNKNYAAEIEAKYGVARDFLPQRDLRVAITGIDCAHQTNSVGYMIHNRLRDAGIEAQFLETMDVTDIGPGGPFNFDFYDYSALVMTHGINALDWFEEQSAEKMAKIIEVNLTGSLYVSHAFVQQTLPKRYRKTIISIGSMAYKSVLNGSAAYCASKAGLAHLMKCLAFELGPKGYDVYSIHPSNIEGSPMTEETIEGLMRYRNLSREEAIAYWSEGSFRSSPLSTQEIADLCVSLVRGEYPYLSGSNIELAGGMR